MEPCEALEPFSVAEGGVGGRGRAGEGCGEGPVAFEGAEAAVACAAAAVGARASARVGVTCFGRSKSPQPKKRRPVLERS